MGTSFVEWQQHGFWVRDSTLEVWLHFMVAEIVQLPDPSAWLGNLRDHWLEQVQFAPPGAFWVGLDKVVHTSAQRAALVQLGTHAIQNIESYGALLPCAYLNSIARAGTYWTVDQPSEEFLRVGHAFIQLLCGELTTNASTSGIF